MLVWCSLAADRISRRKRSSDSGPFDQMPADNLEHFRPPHQLVFGEVDHAHPASPQLADDLVVGMVGQPRRQGVGRRWRGGNGSAALRYAMSPTATIRRRTSPADPGLLEPAQKIVGRQLGNPPLTVRTRLQVLAHRLGRGIVELAQAIGLQDRVVRVDGGSGAHVAISGAVTASTSIGQSLIRKGRNIARPAAKKPI